VEAVEPLVLKIWLVALVEQPAIPEATLGGVLGWSAERREPARRRVVEETRFPLRALTGTCGEVFEPAKLLRGFCIHFRLL
jgi:hypothetical protein